MKYLPLIVVVSFGCAKKRDPAPTEMEDLVRYLFLHWDEDELLPEGMDNLQAWLDQNITSEQAKDGFELTPLTDEDVASVDHPGRDLSLLIGACGAAVSPFPIARQAEHIVVEDQVFANPGTYDQYARTVSGDVETFLAGSGSVATSNAVITSTLGITIPYTLLKDYKWAAGELGSGILARSWIEDASCNDGGGSCLNQSFSVDVFFVEGDTTERMTASWSEVASSVPLSDDILVASLANGIQDVFENTDAFLAGE